eukprot:6489255-Amphidinium_carterae.4
MLERQQATIETLDVNSTAQVHLNCQHADTIALIHDAVRELQMIHMQQSSAPDTSAGEEGAVRTEHEIPETTDAPNDFQPHGTPPVNEDGYSTPPPTQDYEALSAAPPAPFTSVPLTPPPVTNTVQRALRAFRRRSPVQNGETQPEVQPLQHPLPAAPKKRGPGRPPKNRNTTQEPNGQFPITDAANQAPVAPQHETSDQQHPEQATTRPQVISDDSHECPGSVRSLSPEF